MVHVQSKVTACFMQKRFSFPGSNLCIARAPANLSNVAFNGAAPPEQAFSGVKPLWNQGDSWETETGRVAHSFHCH